MIMEKDDNEEVYKNFKKLVNMTALQLEKWLLTDESKNTGQDSGDGEAIGHKSSKHIIKILKKKMSELTEGDSHAQSGKLYQPAYCSKAG